MTPKPGTKKAGAGASLRALRKATKAAADPAKATILSGFFKTDKGEYGEGDRFLGIPVPALRRLAREFRSLSLQDCQRLLQSPFNEERVVALLILIQHHTKGDAARRDAILRLYLKGRRRVNNWNLVDLSAPAILGETLAALPPGQRPLLRELARSPALWDRRIAVVATLTFIRRRDFIDALALIETLLDDQHDLMHKACGWMLREIGKRDIPTLEKFLERHRAAMPRTTLRYAIERFSPERRQYFLARKPVA